MAKKRQENLPSEQEATPKVVKKPAKKRANGDLPWHPFWRWLVSWFVVVHLMAVFCAPWDLLTNETLPPGSLPLRYLTPEEIGKIPPEIVQQPVVPRSLRRFFHHYLNLLYLNHGYEFFAPDPAGTHVIDYQVTQADGKVVEGRLPSLDEQWPRLFYHRHMMLAEQTQLMGPESGQHYADHLATLHNGASRMELKMHFLLPPHRVAAETPLEEPSTYQLLGTVNGRPRAKRIDTELPAPQPGAQQ